MSHQEVLYWAIGVGLGAALFIWWVIIDPLTASRRKGLPRVVRDGANGWWLQVYDGERWYDHHGPLTEETAMKVLMELTQARADRKALAQRKPVRRIGR